MISSAVKGFGGGVTLTPPFSAWMMLPVGASLMAVMIERTESQMSLRSHPPGGRTGGIGTGFGGSPSVSFFDFLFAGALVMTIRPAFVAVLCLALGCGPGSPTKPPGPPEINRITVDQLCATFRLNFNDRTFRDQFVQVHIGAKDYRVTPTRIEAHFVNPGAPACLYFECPFPPPDESAAIVITGICRGCVRDGLHREPGVDYYVRVENCSVTILTAP